MVLFSEKRQSLNAVVGRAMAGNSCAQCACKPLLGTIVITIVIAQYTHTTPCTNVSLRYLSLSHRLILQRFSGMAQSSKLHQNVKEKNLQNETSFEKAGLPHPRGREL